MSEFNIVSDIAGLNQALFTVTHGLYVLTSSMDDQPNGQCLDAMMQITNVPPRVTIGVGKRSLTGEMILKTGVFVVNVIDRENSTCYEQVKHFGFQSGRKVNKFESLEYVTAENGMPIIPCAKSFFECRVIADKTLDLGTHYLFIADVTRAGTHESGDPLTYAQYRQYKSKGDKHG